ncbi:MAG: glycosyltransferase, partial [Alphaproteobacteria bacterium]|nr:glycosyltransferase [Alphaproteobacteria bacterium]
MNSASKLTLERRRVVILARSLEVGGAETQLAALAKGLPTDRFDVTVACLYAKGPLMSELQAAGVHILSLEKKGRWDIFSFFARTRRTLADLQPDILHSFLTPPNILSSLIIKHLNNCKLVWGVRASNMDMSNYDWTWALTFRLECLLSRRPDIIVANADAGKKYVVDMGFPHQSMTVIPNGIDTSRYSVDKEAGQAIRQEFGLTMRDKLIGIVARLDPMKDHRTFLQAAGELTKIRPDVRFLCIGYGASDYEQSLKQLASDLNLDGKIVWTGQRRDLPDLYSALDIATLTSAYGEGFPNTIGEAMSCEVPCLGTDVGDTAKVIGDTGIVTPIGDVNAIVDGWLAMLSETPDEQSVRHKRCQQRIVDIFSLETMIESHTLLYDQLCEGVDKG